MNHQSYERLPSIGLLEAKERMGVENGTFADDMSYYAWPETFGSTAGPFGGIGGAAMTTFTIEAWEDNSTGRALLFCRGIALRVVDRLVPLGYRESCGGAR